MLLGDADVEGAGREALGELVEAGAGGHGGVDGDDLLVVGSFGDEAVGEDTRVARSVALGFGLGSGDDVELGDAVVFVGRAFSGGVAFPLFRDDMHQDRPGLGVAHVLQDGEQMVEVVAVDRADIVEAELLEHGAAGEEGSRIFLGLAGALPEEFRQFLADRFGAVAQGAVGLAGNEAGEIGAHGAGRRGDRHVVVVEDDDEAGVERAGVVHRLVGHAGAHGAVADDRDDVVGGARQIAGHGHAEAGRDRGRGVAGAERVVFALGALGKARQAAFLPDGAHRLAAAGEELVRIGLMADVPDQPVVRGVEDVVQGDGELDDAEAGAQMPAGLGDGVDEVGAQFVGDLSQLAFLEFSQVGRRLDAIEQRGRRLVGHEDHLFSAGQ